MPPVKKDIKKKDKVSEEKEKKAKEELEEKELSDKNVDTKREKGQLKAGKGDVSNDESDDNSDDKKKANSKRSGDGKDRKKPERDGGKEKTKTGSDTNAETEVNTKEQKEDTSVEKVNTTSNLLGEALNVPLSAVDNKVTETDSKPTKDSVEVKKTPIQLKDILDAISVVMTSSERLGVPGDEAFIDVMNMVVESPKRVTEMTPQLQFKLDTSREWCLMTLNQVITPSLQKMDGSIDSFIFALHHVIEGTVKSFFRRFNCIPSMTMGDVRITLPEKIGFPANVVDLNVPGIDDYIMANRENFRPRGNANRQYEVARIVLPQCFHAFHTNTQNFLNENAFELRQWLEDFVVRKRTRITANVGPVFPEIGINWDRCSSPRLLCELLSQIPNYNMLSVSYASEFVFPEFFLSSYDMSAVMTTLGVTTTKAEPLGSIISGTSNSSNEEDYKRIMMALMFPQQVQIQLEINRSSNRILNGVLALLCKLFFSTSPFFRNIAPSAARTVDVLINDMLLQCGYHQNFGEAPLHVHGPPNAIIWAELATNDANGMGWVNHLSNPSYDIINPLYDGINVLPVYGNQFNDADVNERLDDRLPAPPILVQILACLQNSNRRGNELAKFHNFLSYYADSYQSFLIAINRHIITYGETGFRLSDASRIAMENNILNLDQDNRVLNKPLQLRVSLDSIGKFFMRMPTEFTPSERVYKQPIAESLTSAEIQRVLSIFRVTMTWIRREGWERRYPIAKVLSSVVESVESNRIAKKIIAWCLRNGDIKRINADILLNAVLPDDDFEAVFFPECANIVYEHSIIFGFTRDVVYAPLTAMTPVGAAAEALRPTGIMFQNALTEARLFRMSVEGLDQRLSRMSLLSYIYNNLAIEHPNGPIYVTLPGYILYDELITDQLKADVGDAFKIQLTGVTDLYRRRESIAYGRFSRQFVLPPVQSPAFPDQYLLGARFLNYWYVGAESLTRTTTVDSLNALLVDVNCFYDYVRFRNPLDLAP